eukprot:1269871-Prymnesium_polylepis.2
MRAVVDQLPVSAAVRRLDPPHLDCLPGRRRLCRVVRADLQHLAECGAHERGVAEDSDARLGPRVDLLKRTACTSAQHAKRLLVRRAPLDARRRPHLFDRGEVHFREGFAVGRLDGPTMVARVQVVVFADVLHREHWAGVAVGASAHRECPCLQRAPERRNERHFRLEVGAARSCLSEDGPRLAFALCRQRRIGQMQLMRSTD